MISKKLPRNIVNLFLNQMTKGTALKKQYLKAVKSFDEILKKKKSDIIRDSAIKRFEICFDLSWKLIKAFLEDEKGVLCASPKDCFRQAYKLGLINYDELWLKMTNWRNEAVHTYSEKFADDLYQRLPKTLKLFQGLKQKFIDDNNKNSKLKINLLGV